MLTVFVFALLSFICAIGIVVNIANDSPIFSIIAALGSICWLSLAIDAYKDAYPPQPEPWVNPVQTEYYATRPIIDSTVVINGTDTLTYYKIITTTE